MKPIANIVNYISMTRINGILLALLGVCILVFAHAQNPQIQWAVQSSSPALKYIQAMTVDSEGNTLVAIGSSQEYMFAGLAIPHLSLLNGPSAGATLIKMDPFGNVVWHRSLRGPWQTSANCGGIDTDENNNIYVSFKAASNIENASPIGGLYAFSSRPRDYFLVKISPEGNGIWFKSANYISNTSSGVAPCIKVSSDGGVYSCGSLQGSVNIDGIILVNEDISSLYVAKHDLDGNTLWAKKISSTNGDIWPIMSLEVSSDGGAFIAGVWAGDSLNIDHLSIVNDLAFTGNSDQFICKISPDGLVDWLAREHSISDQWRTNLAVTPGDELLVLSKNDDAVLNIGDTALNGAGIVLSRYSHTGEVLGAAIIGEDYDDQQLWTPDITSDNQGGHYVTGTFTSPSYLFGGIQVTNTGGTTGTGDIYVAKINEIGEAEWIYTLGSNETERGRFIKVTDANRVVIGASYEGYGLNIQGITLLPHTEFNTEQFLASFSTALNTRTAEALQQLLAYPNPFTENVQFDTEALQAFGNATLVVFNTNGTEVYRKQLQGNDLGQISLGHLPKGAYVGRLSDGKRSLHTKIIKQ